MRKILFVVAFLLPTLASADTAVTLFSSTTNYFQLRPAPAMAASYIVIMPLTLGATNQLFAIESVVGNVVKMKWLTGSGGGGGVWGAIAGTLSDQTDLQGELNALGASTGTLQGQIDTLSVSTASIQTQIDGLATIYLTQSSATANFLTFSSATANYLTLSSASATYLQIAQDNSGYAMEPSTVTLQADLGLTASTLTVTGLSVLGEVTSTDLNAFSVTASFSTSDVGVSYACAAQGADGILHTCFDVVMGGVAGRQTGILLNVSGGVVWNRAIHVVAGAIRLDPLSASLPVKTDANKELVAAAIDLGTAEVTGTLDISANTNLSATNGVVLIGDTISVSSVSLSTQTVGVLGVANGGTNLTAASDDQVMIGNGSAWQSKALPDCAGATTDKLLYNAATNTISCGTDQVGAGGSGTTIWIENNLVAFDNAVSTMSFNETAGFDPWVLTQNPAGQVDIEISTNVVAFLGNAQTFSTPAGSTFTYHLTVGSITAVNLNASEFVKTDANKKLVSAPAPAVDTSDDTNLTATIPIFLVGDNLNLTQISLSTGVIGTLDISDNTNLAVTGPIILTGDTLSLQQVSLSTGVTGTLPAGNIGTHASAHENGGGDEISVAGLSGLLADSQNITLSTGTTDIATSSRVAIVAGTGITVALEQHPSSATFTVGSVLGTLINAIEMADEDHGDVAWLGGVATVENIAAANIETGILPNDVIASSVGAAVVGILQLSASGTSDGTTFLRGDNTWATPAGSGDAVLGSSQPWAGRNVYISTAGIVLSAHSASQFVVTDPDKNLITQNGINTIDINAGLLPTDVIASSIARAGFFDDLTVRANLGLAIGSDVQAWDADLDDLADGELSGSKVGSGIAAANIAAGFLGNTVVASSMTEHASTHEDAGHDEIAVTAGMMNTGTSADATTFWRGDDTWAVPGGSGDAVIGSSQPWAGRNVYTSTAGIVLAAHSASQFVKTDADKNLITQAAIDLTSDVTGTLPVANGGTGATALTDGGVLLGSDGGAITAMSVLADGSIIVGDGATDPVALAAFTSSTGDLIHEAGGLEADVSAFAGLVAISGGATAEVNSKSELETQIADVSDFAQADGDVYAGTHNFGGADDLEIPNGTNPTVDVTGQIALDTTAGQLLAFDGDITHVVGFSTHSVTVTISSGTGWDSLSIPVWRAPTNMAATITRILAESLPAGSTVLYQLDETVFGATASAGTDVFSIEFSSANNTGVTTTAFSNPGIAAESSLVFNTPAAGAGAGSPDLMTFTIFYTRNRE